MLTHIAIANAKPAAKPYNLTDGDGLFVTIQTNGSKLWRFRYRFHLRQKTLHFGQWPGVSLADARDGDWALRIRPAGSRVCHRAPDSRIRLPKASFVDVRGQCPGG